MLALRARSGDGDVEHDPRLRHTGRMKLSASTAVIRRWAREQGIDVGDRGRLSPAVVAAYEADVSGTTSQQQAPRIAAREVGNISATGYRIGAFPVSGATATARRVRARIS
jgi:hypothetical protein